jgi:hypothetical protein
MINEARERRLEAAFKDFVLEALRAQEKGREEMAGKEIKSVTFSDRHFDTVIVQFRALGLIRPSERKRSLNDTAAYWTLTPYGDRLMVQLRALRRSDAGEEEGAPEGSAEGTDTP